MASFTATITLQENEEDFRVWENHTGVVVAETAEAVEVTFDPDAISWRQDVLFSTDFVGERVGDRYYYSFCGALESEQSLFAAIVSREQHDDPETGFLSGDVTTITHYAVVKKDGDSKWRQATAEEFAQVHTLLSDIDNYWLH